MVVQGTTKLTRKGQMTVPAEIRKAMGLLAGERLQVRYDEATRTMSVECAKSIVERTYGILRSKRKYSIEEEKRLIDEGMAADAIERDARSRGH